MRLITSFLLLLLSLPTLANKKDVLELTPFIGYRIGGEFDENNEDTRIELEDASSFGLLFAWPYDSHRQGELLLSHYDTDFTENSTITINKPGLSVTYLHLGGNVQIAEGVVPFWINGGLGLAHLSPDDNLLNDETKFSANIGINTRFKLSESLSFRIDGRVFGTFFNSDSRLFCDNADCTVYITSNLWVQSELSAGLTFSF